jgi:hypothetical protein
MSKVSPFSSFRMEDFPSQRDWIDKLFLPLNIILAQMSQALNGQITFGDNIPSFIKVLSGQNLTVPQNFKLDVKFTPTQMIVGHAIKDGTPICMVGAWSLSGDTLTVSKLFEITEDGNIPLDPDSKYTITLKFT